MTPEELAKIRTRVEWATALTGAGMPRRYYVRDVPALMIEVERLNKHIEMARNELSIIARNIATPGVDPAWQLGFAHSLVLAVIEGLGDEQPADHGKGFTKNAP